MKAYFPFALVFALAVSLGGGADFVWSRSDDPKAGTEAKAVAAPGIRGTGIEPNAQGMAAEFPAEGVALLSWISLAEIPGSPDAANDVWGYTSPSGREYAILGVRDATVFVETTDPVNAEIVEVIPGVPSVWRDMKTFGEFAYSISDVPDKGFSPMGLQIINLTEIDDGVVKLAATPTLFGLERAHNISLDPASGFIYFQGVNEMPAFDVDRGGIVAYDISLHPTNPRFAGVWDGNFVHDSFPVTFTEGPNAGRQIIFCASALEGVQILDATDKDNIQLIGQTSYPNQQFTHQGWLSEDRRFFFVNDELDERDDDDVATTTTYVIDVEDLTQPKFLFSFTNGNPAVDHNAWGRNGFLFEANYRSGLRVYDIRNMDRIREVGFFDTFPEDDAPEFTGAWGVFVDLPSGVVLVSDRNRGLFVLDATEATSTAPFFAAVDPAIWSGLK